MTTKKLGRQTVALANPPTLAGHANVVGKKEGEGPLASSFDLIGSDDTFGEATWEKSESAMQKQALALALDKAGYILAGEDCRTGVQGVFAAGDCRTKPLRQIVTATADGAVAAFQAGAYLSAEEEKKG